MSADDFFSRWERRNQAEKAQPVAVDDANNLYTDNSKPELASNNCSQTELSSKEDIENSAPTLQDAEALTTQSDFTRFMKSDVDASVKNTALKQLWTDPRFNVQDGLDVYIDDYSKPDPMPEGMLAKLAHTSFLSLFDKKDDDEQMPSASVASADVPEKALPSTQATVADAAEDAITELKIEPPP